jgi:hypothetical protein
MAKPVSQGQCYLCGESFSRAGMTRHVAKCRHDHALEKLAGRGKKRTTNLFHIVVESAQFLDYWLHVEAPGDATLRDLDLFLRDIWLECCGHLSAFTIQDVRYELDTGGVDGMWSMFFGPAQAPRTMDVPLSEAVSPKVKFYHEYDFGTTTALLLRVIGEYAGEARGKSVQLLARNDPPPIVCEKCGQPATQVCAQCIYEGAGWLCDRHAPRHKCGEDMLLPVVNSPRVGTCGYTGPLEA